MSYAERRSGKLTGWWYGEAEVRTENTEHRFRRRFKTKGEADGYEAYVKATGQEPPGMTDAPVESFSAVAASFRARTPEWGRKDKSAMDRLAWVEGQIGKLDIRQVTTVQLDKLVDKLRKLPGRAGEKLGNRTINRYLDAASVVLRFAHKRELIPGMPHVPRLENSGNDRTETLTFDMENAVCKWIEEHRHASIAFVVRVLAETGFRRGELWKLEPEQVGNERITLRKEQTKTEAARVVTVPADMATKLRAMIAADALPKPDHVYNVFKEAVKACGGADELTVYSLRHTRATRLIAAGVDGLIVAQLLGHKSTQTTKRYVHSDVDTLAQAAKKVHQARGETSEKGDVIDFASKKTA
jgi:integrase